MMAFFRTYLLTGGMPDAVNTYITTHNIIETRQIQTDIHDLYGDDAAKYEQAASRKLKIMRIYQMIPSNMENRKKRIVAKDIEGKQGKRMNDYLDEFEYLISSGVALEVKAVSKPSFPLMQNSGKNLLKLYLNDVGLLTSVLYGRNVMPILRDERSVNLGAVYESVVAQELKAHGHDLYYYDNKKLGEVDYLTDDQQRLSVLPIEVKSGKDYTVHSEHRGVSRHPGAGILQRAPRVARPRHHLPAHLLHHVCVNMAKRNCKNKFLLSTLTTLSLVVFILIQ